LADIKQMMQNDAQKYTQALAAIDNQQHLTSNPTKKNSNIFQRQQQEYC
jgi:hypothetical protein